MNTYIRAPRYTCIHTCTHSPVHTCNTCVCLRACVQHTSIHAHMPTCTRAQTCVRTCTRARNARADAHVRTCVRVYTRMCVHAWDPCSQDTANLRTKILDYRGFDSSRILILRGGIPGPIGNSPESLSQAILAGVILVGRLGVCGSRRFSARAAALRKRCQSTPETGDLPSCRASNIIYTII